MKLSVVPGDVLPELSFVDAMRTARKAGIDAVEVHAWWEEDLPAILEASRELAMPVATVCAPFLDITDRSTHAEYLNGMRDSIEAARQAACGIVIVTTGRALGPDRSDQHEAIVECLRRCVPLAEKAGVVLAIEPLNVDPAAEGAAVGYYLWSSDEAFRICDEVGSRAMGVLFDMYHQQVMEGNITHRIRSHLPRVFHLHAAGVPGRHELDLGELNYANLFADIARAGYDGYIGLEYLPTREVASGLATAVSYRRAVNRTA